LNRVGLEKQNLEKVVREKRNEVKTLEEKIKLINVAKSIESGKIRHRQNKKSMNWCGKLTNVLVF